MSETTTQRQGAASRKTCTRNEQGTGLWDKFPPRMFYHMLVLLKQILFRLCRK